MVVSDLDLDGAKLKYLRSNVEYHVIIYNMMTLYKKFKNHRTVDYRIYCFGYLHSHS